MCSSVCECYIESTLSARRVERRSSKNQSIYHAKMCLCEKLIDGFFSFLANPTTITVKQCISLTRDSKSCLTHFTVESLVRNERGDRNTKEALPKLLNDGFTASCWGQRENQQDTMTGNVGLIVEFTGIHLLKYFSFHYLSTHYSHSGLLQISDAQYNFQCVFCGVILGVIQL